MFSFFLHTLISVKTSKTLWKKNVIKNENHFFPLLEHRFIPERGAVSVCNVSILSRSNTRAHFANRNWRISRMQTNSEKGPFLAWVGTASIVEEGYPEWWECSFLFTFSTASFSERKTTCRYKVIYYKETLLATKFCVWNDKVVISIVLLSQAAF